MISLRIVVNHDEIPSKFRGKPPTLSNFTIKVQFSEQLANSNNLPIHYFTIPASYKSLSLLYKRLKDLYLYFAAEDML